MPLENEFLVGVAELGEVLDPVRGVVHRPVRPGVERGAGAGTFGSEHQAAPDNVIYRLAMHVAETDDDAIEDMRAAGGGLPSIGLSFSNRAIEQAAAESSYYGRDVEGQRARLQSRGEVVDRIDKGQILVGSPDTVLKQIVRIRNELGDGVLDLAVASQLGNKTAKAIELFGIKVLPRMHEL